MRPTWQIVAAVYVFAVAVNYPWELAQSSLFTTASHGGNVWLDCFIASLGDGVMVLLLFGFGWLAVGHRHWFVHPGRGGYAMLLVAGAGIAVAVEWIAVHVLQRWTYSDAMPRLPALDVGLVPVLQMVLLPPFIFHLVAAVRRR